MDPNEALARGRALLALRDTYAWTNDTQALLDSLADTFRDLDSFLSKGGFLPKEWTTHPRAALDNVAEQVAGAVRTAKRGRHHPGRPGGQNSGA